MNNVQQFLLTATKEEIEKLIEQLKEIDDLELHEITHSLSLVQ